MYAQSKNTSVYIILIKKKNILHLTLLLMVLHVAFLGCVKHFPAKPIW